MEFLERHDLAEAELERLELLLDSAPEAVLAQELDVLVLVVLGDGDVGAAGHELGRLERAERLVLGRKVELEDVRDVVLAHPRQRLVQLLVDDGHVVEADRATETRLVDGGREVHVEEAAVEDGEADAATDELDCAAKRRRRGSARRAARRQEDARDAQYDRWSSLMLLFGLTWSV